MRSLEEAQVFINHVKSSYGPLTQYQFARVCLAFTGQWSIFFFYTASITCIKKSNSRSFSRYGISAQRLESTLDMDSSHSRTRTRWTRRLKMHTSVSA
jgi:hypothetical protein